ncbi:hypothetical protein GOP47_0010367 [Adiantum capillus-veneris]|uniref:HMA domain-containing protein n=1 Tax=Adiantum capillus-veneris TaxID=13818 RepID=A0A9D4UUM5_ADICA|nr:hypothetical protein GOP47_0010367 [Adiantum capillus-veneris]
MELVELLVRMDCQGCEQKVRKQLAKLKGVDSVEVDLRTNKVTVYGFVDRRKVLKAVRKSGKKAEFWQEAFTNLHHFPHHSTGEASNITVNYNFTGSQYSHNYSSSSSEMSQIQPFKRTYNYKKHGYNNYDYSTDDSMPYYHQQGISTSHAAPSMFSDEDPNGCSVM